MCYVIAERKDMHYALTASIHIDLCEYISILNAKFLALKCEEKCRITSNCGVQFIDILLIF